MATAMQVLYGGDIPSQFSHLEKVFRVTAEDGAVLYFETMAETAKAMSELMIKDRIKNGVLEGSCSHLPRNTKH